MATAPEAVISPIEAFPFDQRKTVPPIRATGRIPAIVIKQRRKTAEVTPKEIAFLLKISIDLSATWSSCSACEKSFTVFMFVMVSTTCPETFARAPARSADCLRTFGRNALIKRRYKINQTINTPDILRSIVTSKSTEPTSEAKENAPTFTISVTTSVNALDVCICFCAMRPAKSSSKKVTAWPIVHL